MEGELALFRGDTVAAERAFDAAARLVHAGDIEMGLVRTYMQAGDYRRAMAFAAHTAGAHRDEPAAAAQYAWLLHIGGQGAAARRVIDKALADSPGDSALLGVQELLVSPTPRPTGLLLTPPLRIAPGAPLALPPGVRAVGTAVLLGDGLSALVPAASIAGARRIWLRNALGQTVVAQADPTTASAPLAHLQLGAALPAVAWLIHAPAYPYAGSPAYAIEYGAAAGAEPEWPLLHIGFFGRRLATPSDQLLGINLPEGPRGGPVFDGRGQLAGIAVPGADGRDRLLRIDAPALNHAPATATSAPTPPARVSEDALYEVGMRVALQLIVLH